MLRYLPGIQRIIIAPDGQQATIYYKSGKVLALNCVGGNVIGLLAQFLVPIDANKDVTDIWMYNRLMDGAEEQTDVGIKIAG